MRFLAALAAVAVVAASAESDVTATPDTLETEGNSDVTVLEDGSEYVVKLGCSGCPFAAKSDNGRVSWPEAPQDNALRLVVALDTLDDGEPALFLNGRSIFPLDRMPLDVNAFQVPANMTEDNLLGLYPGASFTEGVQMPLQYEHAVLPTHEAGQFWVQFDVLGLPLDKMNDPSVMCAGSRQTVRLDHEEQKLVQILVEQDKETGAMMILGVQTVLRKDRVQPLQMKCGNLAVVLTKYDPHEWDVYGKLGSWSRYQTMIVDTWNAIWEDSALTILMAVGLSLLILGVKACYLYVQRAKASAQRDAEVALLVGSDQALLADYEDAPPAYANIPVIKIEEYK